MSARRLAVVVSLGGLAAAGAYVLVYLVRWEWHRALVAGVFMLALEIGVGLAFVFERLRSIEARLDGPERERLDATRRAITDARPNAPRPFAWLEDAANRTSVFVPILLGAGVVLSAAAWAVERMAHFAVRPGLERGLAARVEPLTLAPGTLLGLAPAGLPASPRDAVRRRPWRWAIVALAVVPSLFLGQAIDTVADATQNRPDANIAGSAGRVVLRVDSRNVALSDDAVARSMWAACQIQIGTRYRLTGVELLDADRVELRVRPSVGKYAERRLRGCFEDATTDRVSAEVLTVASR
ncbi:MAG TPA: hypothetical protein VFV35_00195 [Acidimicrobiales bacterium]|nr:hypothetical protein [Acidimicrobiales bacterium]